MRSRSVSCAAIAAFCASLAAPAPRLEGCPYSIRDSAFIGRGSAVPFRLVFPSRNDKAGRTKLLSWIEKASASWLRDSNVVAELVDLREKESSLPRRLHDNLRDTRTPPAAILLAADDRVYRFDPPGAEPNADSVMRIAATAVDSPMRAGLQSTLVDSWCVIVFTPGSDPSANTSARTAISRAAKKLAGKSTELGKVIESAPRIIEVTATTKDEAIVLWSLDLVREGEKLDRRPPRAVIVAGRGETRGPTLEGDDVDEAKMSELLEMLGRSCSCTTSPKWLIGTAIPLTWNDTTRRAARDQLGFDPLDPKVLRSIRGATRLPDQLTGLDSFDAIELGYEEIDLEGDVQPEPATAASSTATPSKESRAEPDPASKSTVVEARTIATRDDPEPGSPPRTEDADSPGTDSAADGIPRESASDIARYLMIAIGGIAVLVALASLLLVGRSRRT